MKYSALIVAAGAGKRMNLGYNKVYHKLEDGDRIIDKTIKTFKEDDDCKQIIVVTNKDNFYQLKDYYSGEFILVEGGSTRSESVFNGLKAVSQEYVFVHDGARCYLNNNNLSDLKTCLKKEDACILAVKAVDTIKRVKDGYIEETIDRNQIYYAQTPQAFKFDLLYNSYIEANRKNLNFTDDASLVEGVSACRIKVVIGSYANKKITTINDLK